MDDSQIKEDFPVALVQNFLTSQKVETGTSLRENYGSEFQSHILEQYKLYVEMADRLSARRVQLTTLYTSILSGLLALLSITGNKDLFHGPQSFVLFVISILGLSICVVWTININSYKQLNFLKFKVIHEMEAHLAFPCYDREWEILKENRNKQHYLRLTAVEKYIPTILALPYVCLLIYSIISIVKA